MKGRHDTQHKWLIIDIQHKGLIINIQHKGLFINIQHKGLLIDIQHKGLIIDIQHNDTQLKDTQHNNIAIMLNISCAECRVSFIVMLNVIMLSVVMLSVVAPMKGLPGAKTLAYLVRS
jgi:hypothetical protein